MKKILLFVVLILIILQFFRPEKNLSDDQTYAIEQKYSMPANIQDNLEVACKDCHSNKTRYPWYSNIQPVAFYLNSDITEGKEHLNFSEFIKYPIAVQNKKFDAIADLVKKKAMPLKSYTYLGLHKDAKLTDKQRNDIINWAYAQMDTLKKHYPADSLILKRKKS